MNFPRAIYLAKRPFCDWPFEFTHHIRRSLDRAAQLDWIDNFTPHLWNIYMFVGWMVILCMAFGKTIYYTLITDTQIRTHTHKKKRCVRSPNKRTAQTNERMNVIHNIYLNSGKVYAGYNSKNSYSNVGAEGEERERVRARVCVWALVFCLASYWTNYTFFLF